MSILQRLSDLKKKKPNRNPIQTRKEPSVTIKIVASLIIALSGLILYADKALIYLNLTFPLPEKYQGSDMEFDTYIWVISQSLSPILIILGAYLRPYNIVYSIPLYSYCLQLYFILLDTKRVDNSYLQAYVIGTTILIMLCFYGIRLLIELLVRRRLLKTKEKIKTILQDV